VNRLIAVARRIGQKGQYFLLALAVHGRETFTRALLTLIRRGRQGETASPLRRGYISFEHTQIS
jgi:hypothetical protein